MYLIQNDLKSPTKNIDLMLSPRIFALQLVAFQHPSYALGKANFSFQVFLLTRNMTLRFKSQNFLVKWIELQWGNVKQNILTILLPLYPNNISRSAIGSILIKAKSRGKGDVTNEQVKKVITEKGPCLYRILLKRWEIKTHQTGYTHGV